MPGTGAGEWQATTKPIGMGVYSTGSRFIVYFIIDSIHMAAPSTKQLANPMLSD